MENQTRLLGYSQDNSVSESNQEEHSDVPIEPQDEEVLLDDVDLGASEDQPHDATTGSQSHNTFQFESNTDYTYSPAPELGPSRVSARYREVFNVGPQSEYESEEESEQSEGTYKDEETLVRFRPDTASESEEIDDDDIHTACFEDPTIARGEEAYQLDIQQKLDDLGSSVLSVVARDNIKAMALKIGNQLTRNAFKGVQKLTRGHMAIETEYVANRILEHASGLSVQIYDCCVNTCVCFTGELESLTTCPMCGEPRVDKRNKARNRFRYIPIIPRLQAMFRDRDTIASLLYRYQREVDQDRIEDVWDGAVLQELLKTKVMIDGQVQEYTYGELQTDVFLALTCDGISVHKGIGARHSKTEYACFPLELIMLNLPPEIRTQDQYVYSLGVIPGPHEPKHLDSFCWPFYQECLLGLQGIRTYHTIDRQMFPLRFYCPLGFGDLKAMIKLKGTVGVGTLKPCHECNVSAIRDTSSIGQRNKTYYIPLTIPRETEHRLEKEILSNLRSHEQYEATYHRLDTSANEAERKRIRRETGISHVCLFSLLPYYDMARAVPHGFMHAVYINQFKALIKLWRGEFKGLDVGTGNYTLPGAIWHTVGIETRCAVKTIPSVFICSIPNIDCNFNSFTAEDGGFWLTWLAPYLLADRLPEPYYTHLLGLIKIIKICTGFGMSRDELRELGSEIAEWRLDYEEHYYQYDPKRLSVMTLTSHALDHLPDDILNTGPPPALWEFVTERSMGEVARSVTSRMYPFSQLANTLLQREQLKVMRMKYPDMKDDLDFSRERRNWHIVSKTERYFPEINDQIVLRTPHNWYKLTPTEKVAIGVYFKNLLELAASSKSIAKHIPDKIERWGKIRFKGDAECVRSSWAHESVRETHRDASFARVSAFNSLFNCELMHQ